ncbi:hypothetical protein AURDEDRAFT_165420 [Auricularia subglabra TFB-10046 SS5]|nr:hypothetical protein AURDEDRAFT_165420 [Auricularia subglabra TFB-10046 SS5]
MSQQQQQQKQHEWCAAAGCSGAALLPHPYCQYHLDTSQIPPHPATGRIPPPPGQPQPGQAQGSGSGKKK